MSITILENGQDAEELEQVECRDCCDMIDADAASEIDGDNVCDSCYDNYGSCSNCSDMTHHDDLRTTVDGEVCDSCYDDYYECASCAEVVHSDYVAHVRGDSVCEGCRDNYYSWCEYCDEYYLSDDGPCCNVDCGCEAPRQSFTFPALGGTAAIANDERHDVKLEAGVISPEGMRKIGKAIRSTGAELVDAALAERGPGVRLYSLANDDPIVALHQVWSRLSMDFDESPEVGNTWAGERGNFTKRLSRYAYSVHKISLAPGLVSEIGNIARANSVGSDVSIEMTRDLNQSASDFYHEDSCWWTEYSESRCALKSNGGIGMRTFGPVEYPEYGYQHGPWANDYGRAYVQIGVQTYDTVTGRAWVMPVRIDGDIDNQTYDYNRGKWVNITGPRWVPTFDAEAADGYIVFNGYGELSDYAPARILAQMTGMTYRKVGFSCGPMYVNNDSAFLVTSKDVADALDDNVNIHLDVDTHSNLHNRELTNA